MRGIVLNSTNLCRHFHCKSRGEPRAMRLKEHCPTYLAAQERAWMEFSSEIQLTIHSKGGYVTARNYTVCSLKDSKISKNSFHESTLETSQDPRHSCSWAFSTNAPREIPISFQRIYPKPIPIRYHLLAIIIRHSPKLHGWKTSAILNVLEL